MSFTSPLLQFADKFDLLSIEHSQWSQATFGSDGERGPLGPLRHLVKEAEDAVEAAMYNYDLLVGYPVDELTEELADCFLLLLDASRRAGIKPMQLVEAAQAKLEVNKLRTWPKPDGDNIVEHVRD